jgi:hypothetical protein
LFKMNMFMSISPRCIFMLFVPTAFTRCMFKLYVFVLCMSMSSYCMSTLLATLHLHMYCMSMLNTQASYPYLHAACPGCMNMLREYNCK